MTFRTFYCWFYPVVFVAAFLIARLPASVSEIAAWSPLWCPLKALTGWLCPSCGLTRACLALLRGEFTTAIMYHPLSPVVFIASTLVWLFYFRNKDMSEALAFFKRTSAKIFVNSSLAMIILWGIARNFVAI